MILDKIKFYLNKISPEETFLYLALIFGLLYLLSVQPFQAFDEEQHFNRSYEISEGKFISKKQDIFIGDDIPKKVYLMETDLRCNYDISECRKLDIEKIKKYTMLHKYNKEKNFTSKNSGTEIWMIDFKNTALYSPTLYAPQAIGILMAKVLDFPPLFMLYLGRLFNLIFYALIVFYAIKITPILKWGFVFIGLMPGVLYRVSSMSSEGVCFSLCFLYIALVFNYISSDKDKITNRHIFYASILAFFLGLCKSAYFLISFLIFLIPINKFESKRKFLMSVLIVIGSCLLSWSLWGLVIKNLYVPIRSWVNPQVQLSSIFVTPNIFINAVFESLKHSGYKQYIMYACGLQYQIFDKTWNQYYLYFLIFISCLENNKKVILNFLQKFQMAIIFVLSVLLVDLALYLSWEKIGATHFSCLSERYFVPLYPLFWGLFYNTKTSIFQKYEYVLKPIFLIFLIISLIFGWNFILTTSGGV